MPIVEIHLLEGRSVEQKRALVREVTRAVCETLGAPPEKVRIILDDMAHENYAIAGVLTVDEAK